MSQCFENNRPEEIVTGVEMLAADKPVMREETGYVNETYTDTRPIYMPPIAADLLDELKKKQLAEDQIEFKLQQNILAQLGQRSDKPRWRRATVGVVDLVSSIKGSKNLFGDLTKTTIITPMKKESNNSL